MPEGPINHLSYSQISTYLMCGLRYRFQYVDLISSAFTASSLVFGQAIHEAVGAFYQQHLLGDTLRPDEMDSQNQLDDEMFRARANGFNER